MPLKPARTHQISLSQCALSTLTTPLVLGHYAGQALSETERQLDSLLQGCLQDWLALGLYPNHLLESAVITSSESSYPGVLVMGLGQPGVLTEAQLLQCWVQVLVRYAQALQTSSVTGSVCCLSLLLVGSRSPELGVHGSLRALLHAVIEAQQRLQREGRTTEFVLQCIEQDDFRALEASDELLRLLQLPEFHGYFQIIERVEQLNHPLHVPQNTSNAWWSYWPLVGVKVEQLTLTKHRLQQGLILQLDTQSALYDWELLPFEHKAMALHTGLIRQFPSYQPVALEDTPNAALWLWYAPGQIPLWTLPSAQQALVRDCSDRAGDLMCYLHQQQSACLHLRMGVRVAQGALVLHLTDLDWHLSDWLQLRELPALLVLQLDSVTKVEPTVIVQFCEALLQCGLQGLLLNSHALPVASQPNFLSHFYQSMVRGECLGDAVFKARKEMAAAQQPWESWQVWGNPQLRLIE